MKLEFEDARKYCKGCEQTLSVLEFYPRARHRDGFDYVCRTCRQARTKETTDRIQKAANEMGMSSSKYKKWLFELKRNAKANPEPTNISVHVAP